MTSYSSHCRRTPPRALRRERGVVLMVALIVLVALTLAGLSMVRSVDTGVVIAGNLSFRQAASQAMDAGVEAALTGINATWAGSANAIPNKYYQYMLADTDADGVPDTDVLGGKVDWKQSMTIVDPGGLTGYTVNYVVDRMCVQDPLNAAATITSDLDAQKRCNLEPEVLGFQSQKIGSAGGLGELRKIHYRITVKVTGPRNTETYAEAVIAVTVN